MADSEDKKMANGETNDSNSVTTRHKQETLEDLLTTLSHHINNSDWLQQNTAEKFAVENPEVAKAFRDAAAKSSQSNNREVKEDDV